MYHPHPILVPMADRSFADDVRKYNTAAHDVWGVQPYRGATFGDLFRTYISEKPLLVTEYGMDAYNDVILNDAMRDGLHVDPVNARDGMAYQAEALPRLAIEVRPRPATAAALLCSVTLLCRRCRAVVHLKCCCGGGVVAQSLWWQWWWCRWLGCSCGGRIEVLWCRSGVVGVRW